MDGTSPELVASIADRYRIERQIGQGGMATVYLARDLRHDREVALKVLRPELGAVLGPERFLAEVRITARLDHPHILTLIDSGSAGGMLYYVLPFVRGESLRDLLDREHQLGVEQALAITKQIGSALDYAHRHGVVHRDIKPENVLLHEGEAMLSDFGIALAVQESGGSRLTESGLSLGTPQYMSPEQATGERALDARSDQYSLAAMLYEMLVGDPPLTGRTVQAVVAKLLTEVPTRIRIVRPGVPQHMDDAVAKALSKVPADRFASVAEFVRAVEGTTDTGQRTASGAARRSRRFMVAGAIGAIALAAGAVAIIGSKRLRSVDAPVVLRDRTQLTFTGHANSPAISLDGRQLAYWVRECAEADCRYAIDVQDVGSTTTRRVLEGATTVFGLSWSPDRRNLLALATIAGRFGAYLVPVLGGSPRFLSDGIAGFYAGGDSLLIGPTARSDSGFVIRVAGLDGTVSDSIIVHTKGDALYAIASIPGSRRFALMITRPDNGLWELVDRFGHITDSLTSGCVCGGVASHDALWMARGRDAIATAVLRVGIDTEHGRFRRRQDVVYTGLFTGWSVTADGTRFVVDDGSTTYSVATGELADLLKGPSAAIRSRLEASRDLGAIVSPDGQRLLVRRAVPSSEPRDALRYSIAPFEGGPETPLDLRGRLIGADWIDPDTLFVLTTVGAKGRFDRRDVRTGTVSGVLDIPDSTFRGMAPLPDGWVWIPKTQDRVIVERSAGKRYEIPKPASLDGIFEVDASSDGSRLLIIGYTSSELGLAVVPTTGGDASMWHHGPHPRLWAAWLADGSIALAAWSSDNAVTIHRLTGVGRDSTLGQIRHVASDFNVSKNMKRAVIGWNEYHGDAWSYRVASP